MAAHTFTKDAGAALVFAILYSVLFVWMLAGYITGRFKIRSRWSLLFFHVTIRVVSQVGLTVPLASVIHRLPSSQCQALGIAFGILAFDNVDIFIAYLIMGAEGYFTLVSYDFS